MSQDQNNTNSSPEEVSIDAEGTYQEDDRVKAKLADGRTLSFPKGTSDQDIYNAIKSGYGREDLSDGKGPLGDERGGESKALQRVYHKLAGEEVEVDLDPAPPEPGESKGPYLLDQLGIDGASAIGGYYGAEKAVSATSRFTKNPYVLSGATVVGGFVGSYVGAYGGVFAQHGIHKSLNSPLADDRNLEMLMDRANEEGGLAAMSDLLGSLVLIGGHKTLRKMNGVKGKLGLARIQKYLGKNKWFGDKARTLSLGQAVSDTIIGSFIQSTEGILRGAFLTSAPFKSLDKRQVKPLVDSYKMFTDTIVGFTTTRLKPEAYGKFVLSIADGGKTLHRETSSIMFKALDSLPKTRTFIKESDNVAKKGKPGYGEMSGVPSPSHVADKIVDLPPVNLTGMREVAQEAAALISKIGFAETTTQGLSPLTKLAGGAEHLTFSEAHLVISNLKGLINNDAVKKTPAVKSLIDAVKQAEEAFDVAGNALGGKGTKLYAQAKAFYKNGQKAFNDDMLVKMLDRDPSKLGQFIAKDASVEDITRLQKMVRYTAGLKGSTVKYGETWKKIQAGAVSELMPRSPEHALSAPIFKIADNPEKLDLLTRVLGPDKTEVLLKQTDTYKELLQKASERGNLTPRQIQAMNSAHILSGAATAYYAGATEAIVSFIAVPAVASVAYTTPWVVNLLTTWNKAPIGSATKRRLGAKMFKILVEIYMDPTVQVGVDRESKDEEYGKYLENHPDVPKYEQVDEEMPTQPTGSL